MTACVIHALLHYPAHVTVYWIHIGTIWRPLLNFIINVNLANHQHVLLVHICYWQGHIVAFSITVVLEMRYCVMFLHGTVIA